MRSATKIVVRTDNTQRLSDTVSWRLGPASATFGKDEGSPSCVGAIGIGPVSLDNGGDGRAMTSYSYTSSPVVMAGLRPRRPRGKMGGTACCLCLKQIGCIEY